MIAAAVTRFREGMAWRLRPYMQMYEQYVVGPAAARSGLLARRLRWPIPGQLPWQQRVLEVVRTTALGDVLLCTPALRRVKELNPRCRIVFYTRYPDLVHGLPFLDEVRALGDHEWRPDAISLSYENAVPTRRHLARVIGDALGVDVRDTRPAVVVSGDLKARYLDAWSRLPRPWVVVNRQAGPWTPNKDWPAGHWDRLVHRLLQFGTVIEIGGPHGASPAGPANYLDLRGQTTRPELVAVIAASDLHVGPISGPVHVAAAAGVPSVVIYGGYEPPSCTGYRGNVNLYSPVTCSPCWLRTPCPHDRYCLSAITPEVVEQAVHRLWQPTKGGRA